MGNNKSTEKCSENTNCLICLENISNQKKVVCIKCNIILHSTCEETWRENKGYCKCPHCKRVGTIGIILN